MYSLSELFTGNTYHAHNQKAKIKLNIFVFMFAGGKKDLLQREGIFMDRDAIGNV